MGDDMFQKKNKLSMRKYMQKNQRKNGYFQENNTEISRQPILVDKKEEYTVQQIRGTSVENIQRMLVDIATIYQEMPKIVVNGEFDVQTKEAIIKFQEISGISRTGVIDEETYERLKDIHMRKDFLKRELEEKSLKEEKNETIKEKEENKIQIGCRGRYVTELQKYLNQMSNYCREIPKLTVDGIFGENTQAAVLEFQRVFGLQQDGSVGDETWDAIYDAYLGKRHPLK